tara:strand:- start:8343 stop:8519 length:177 start_codon:yes stop_codon:yes gene_type:complete
MVCTNPMDVRALKYLAKQTKPKEPQIGTIDNEFEYIGNNQWRDTKTERIYDSNGNLIK